MNSAMTIREFAEYTGLSAHTLRYYERIGLMSKVARGPNGHRVYGPHDAQWVAFLHRLRETGMPIREMLRYSAMRAEGDASLARRLALLEQHAEQLAEQLRTQHEHLARLRDKIALYKAQLSGSASALRVRET